MFVAVTSHRSVSAAARALGLSRGQVARRLNALESDLGRSLFDEAGGLTPAGQSLLAGAGPLLDLAEAAVSAARLLGAGRGGHLRIGTPPGLPPSVAQPFFEAIRFATGARTVEVVISDDPAALIPDRVDFAADWGLRPPEGPWVGSVLLRVPVHALASPSFLARNGPIASVADLRRHRLHAWRGGGLDPHRWPLWTGGAVDVEPAAVCNDPHLARFVAAQGRAITLVPDPPIPLERGPHNELVRVLPDVIGCEMRVWGLFPESLRGVPGLDALYATIRGAWKRVGGLGASDR